MLISSHILDELARLATHFGFLDGGRLVRELSAGELEQACRKCVRLAVTDVKALARVLDGLALDYSIVSEREADVFGNVDVTDLALALADVHCRIQSIHERDESLETYYINLIGGGKNE